MERTSRIRLVECFAADAASAGLGAAFPGHSCCHLIAAAAPALTPGLQALLGGIEACGARVAGLAAETDAAGAGAIRCTLEPLPEAVLGRLEAFLAASPGIASFRIETRLTARPAPKV